MVARLVWKEVNSFFSRQGVSIESITSLWVAGKKLDSQNTVVAAVLWALWKHRNGMIFNGVVWLSLNQIWLRTLGMLKRRRLIFKDHMLEQQTDSANICRPCWEVRRTWNGDEET